MKANARVRTIFRLFMVLVLGLLAGWCFLHSGEPSPYRIMEAGAVDSPLSLREVMSGLRPFEKARWKEIAGTADNYLDLGPAKMEWSTGGQGSGHLYAWDVHRHGELVWEFAACNRTSLDDLTLSDIEAPFSRRTSSLAVSDGTIVLARLSTDTNSIYALKVDEQTLRSVRIRFRIIGPKAGLLKP